MQQILQEYEYVQDGDIMIGGVVSVNRQLNAKSVGSNVLEAMLCSYPEIYHYKNLVSFFYAVDEINKNHFILPNLTLGYHIYDSCTDPRKAIKSILLILSGPGYLVPNYSCTRKKKVVGFIGDHFSSTTLPIAQLLGIYPYTQVSYGATDTLLSDRKMFPSFFRTVADDYTTYSIISHFVSYFGWTWVGIISSDDDAGDRETKLLTDLLGSRGICVAFVLRCERKFLQRGDETVLYNYIDKIIEEIKESSARIIIICGTFHFFMNAIFNEIVFSKLDLCGAYNFIWILMSDEWKTAFITRDGHLEYLMTPFRLFKVPAVFKESSGNCCILVSQSILTTFWYSLRTLIPTSPTYNKFLDASGPTTSMPSLRNFNFGSGAFLSLAILSPTQVSRWIQPNCLLFYNGHIPNFLGFANYYRQFISHFSTLVSPIVVLTKKGANPRLWSSSAEEAFSRLKSAFASAPVLTRPDTEKPFHLEICASSVHKYVKSLMTGPEFGFGKKTFTDKGDLGASFVIYNDILKERNYMSKHFIGYYDVTSEEGLDFTIFKENIKWKNIENKVPKSQCSPSCLPGQRKVPSPSIHLCCHDCAPCSDGEISNVSDSKDCMKCPEDAWPDDNRTFCLVKEIEYLSYTEDITIGFSCLSLFFCILTIFILSTFISNRDTPIVRANNKNLSFVLLVSIMLSFLCVFLFLGRPVDITCILRQISTGIFHSVSISSLLAKTITVYIAFKATRPGSVWRTWTGVRLPNCVLLICSSVQVVLCMSWVTLSPPFQELDTHSYKEKVVVQCNEGSDLWFYSVLGYMGVLAAVSFITAFLARTLPDSFNEAKYITFSMLVFCSVWIAMIPAYLSTRGKYMVAVEIFAILTSNAGLLGCIFLPKCYKIIFMPEINTRNHILDPKNTMLHK
ncbi:vomeronasal type-2 receptor 26-like [Engystomops pustulosus]|uniref:vomeronasal type-2 receptor 26-like n=1 Tax=Engystomops pustulosus TaxID=76066 RepID=UPI003AFAE35F